jgi:uncharacterized protein YjbI with pentapeptide repeats
MPKSIPIMATPVQAGFSNEELLAKLKEGPIAWNTWWTSVGYESRRQIDLSNSDLSHCNLRGTFLRDIKFAAANFFETDLREADLRGADLSGAKGSLLGRQLAGADLTGAKLPEPLANLYDKLGSVSDISDSAKKLFLALLAACLYSWLTIPTTKDVDLFTNGGSLPLPVIQTAIPIVGFYIVAPLILLCSYFYFHFYLQKLWEELATLPAVFTDGRPLYARADPWLFNDLVRAHFPRLKEGRPFLSYFQQWISILLAWWMVPVTLLLFWGRFLPRHDLFWTIVLAVLLALSIVSAIRLYQLASSTLRGEIRLSAGESARTLKPYVSALLVCIFAGFFITVSLGAIYEIPAWTPAWKNECCHNPRTWVPIAMHMLHYDTFTYLRGAELSVKPPVWTGTDDGELDRVKGIDLRDRDLRYSYAPASFLVQARLARCDLSDAFLPSADLRKADANHANLARADLRIAHLNGTDLRFISLTQANLIGADLSGAVMQHANLSRADLTDTKLIGADFGDSNLDQANLRGANIRYARFQHSYNLHADQITAAAQWQHAYYDPDMLRQLGLPADHNDALTEYRKSGAQEPFDAWQEKWRKARQKL